jgi:diguanylate cyclase (GGDEF)-like protein
MLAIIGKRISMISDLNELVAHVARTLMAADASNSVSASEEVLTEVAAHYGMDVAFLRHNDHEIRATILIAQWPIRTYVPDPDPIGTVYFDGADPVFAMAEHITEPVILRPETEPDEFQQRIEEGTTVPVVSMAAVPLLATDGSSESPRIFTSGTLGFVKYGDREWTDDEITALQVIASFFAQLKARIEAEVTIKRLATHDDLTGLRSRRSLLEHLEDRLAAGAQGPVGALYIDLDRLKAVNDLLGHTTGDQLIAQIAERMRKHVAGKAFLARLGGDELVVIPKEPTTLNDALALGQGLLEVMKDRFSVGTLSLTCSVSIGVAVGVPGVDSVSDLLRFADYALMAAKAEGGHSVAAFSDALAEQYSLRADIEVNLPDCIDNDELALHYMPEVDLPTGTLVAMEVLARWNHPTRGLLHDDVFMPIAEATNFAGALGRRVLRLACRQLHQWRRAGLAHDVMLRVKVSPVQLVTDGFADYLTSTLSEFDIPATGVCLEMSENVLVSEAEVSQHKLRVLKAIGVGLALDDFGTGYSDLSSLKSLPIDTLMIDRSFVRTLGKDANDVAIIRSVIALAEAFDLELVAEGLELEAAAELLVRMGCRRAQGILVSGPVDAAGMQALLEAPTLRPPMGAPERP